MSNLHELEKLEAKARYAHAILVTKLKKEKKLQEIEELEKNINTYEAKLADLTKE